PAGCAGSSSARARSAARPSSPAAASFSPATTASTPWIWISRRNKTNLRSTDEIALIGGGRRGGGITRAAQPGKGGLLAGLAARLVERIDAVQPPREKRRRLQQVEDISHRLGGDF